jgi:hypothetical protein
LPEHLKNYWKTWCEQRNESNSKAIGNAEFKDIQCLLLPPPRKDIQSIPTTHPVTLSDQITKGRLPPKLLASDSDSNNSISDPAPSSSWEISLLLVKNSGNQSAIQFGFGESEQQKTPTVDASVRSITGRTSEKRKFAAVSKPTSSLGPVVKRRKPRSCIMCRKTDCPAAFMSRPCIVCEIPSLGLMILTVFRQYTRNPASNVNIQSIFAPKT